MKLVEESAKFAKVYSSAEKIINSHTARELDGGARKEFESLVKLFPTATAAKHELAFMSKYHRDLQGNDLTVAIINEKTEKGRARDAATF